MTYGTRLQQSLDFAHKSRKELALHLGCTVQTIGVVITGSQREGRKLSTKYHCPAAEFLGVDEKWLRDGVGQMLIGPTTPVNTAQAATVSIADPHHSLDRLFAMLPADTILRATVFHRASAVILDALNGRAPSAEPSQNVIPEKSSV